MFSSVRRIYFGNQMAYHIILKVKVIISDFYLGFGHITIKSSSPICPHIYRIDFH